MEHYYLDTDTTVMAIIFITCALLYIFSLIYIWIRPSLQERKLKRTEFDAQIDIINEKISKIRKARQVTREFSSVAK
ncbi:hypothetical protein [Bacillus sp. OTU530]|uniref:hypothetical protein n=1 Tax=Bacillus sp. OTU530 TaxID=3043862 RepID=UPI00313B7C5F